MVTVVSSHTALPCFSGDMVISDGVRGLPLCQEGRVAEMSKKDLRAPHCKRDPGFTRSKRHVQQVQSSFTCVVS